MQTLQTPKQLEPEFYSAFRCLGADCPDTCCQDWGVAVDHKTFDKYRQSSDPVFQPLFQKLVTINSAPTSSNYAAITLQDHHCPFLADKLCSIQKHLGEDHLSHTCATFPRIVHEVFGTVERSLDLACPEAARLALTNPQRMHFHLCDAPPSQNIPVISRQTPHASRYSKETRGLVIALLQNRRYPISTRLILVAQLCDLLTRVEKANNRRQNFDLLHEFRNRIETGTFTDHPQPPAFDYGAQLKLVLELINARIRMDFVSPRYLHLFQEFASGIQLETGSDWNPLCARYAQAARDYYLPFMHRHEYILENYLVSYAFRTVLPFAWASANPLAECNWDPAAKYLVMAAYFAIMQTLMIGVSAKYQAGFGIDHVVHCIQSTSKALEHCLPYPSCLVQILAAKGITTAAQMALLTAA